jgi:hypothetical protein
LYSLSCSGMLVRLVVVLMRPSLKRKTLDGPNGQGKT